MKFYFCIFDQCPLLYAAPFFAYMRQLFIHFLVLCQKSVYNLLFLSQIKFSCSCTFDIFYLRLEVCDGKFLNTYILFAQTNITHINFFNLVNDFFIKLEQILKTFFLIITFVKLALLFRLFGPLSINITLIQHFESVFESISKNLQDLFDFGFGRDTYTFQSFFCFIPSPIGNLESYEINQSNDEKRPTGIKNSLKIELSTKVIQCCISNNQNGKQDPYYPFLRRQTLEKFVVFFQFCSQFFPCCLCIVDQLQQMCQSFFVRDSSQQEKQNHREYNCKLFEILVSVKGHAKLLELCYVCLVVLHWAII